MVSRCHSNIVATANVHSDLAKALFTFTQLKNQVKVQVDVFKSFKNSTDKYSFHIHDALVVKGDCMSTKLHYDPFNVNPNGNSTTYKCRKDNIATCEIGDLAGRFQKLDAEPKHYTFFDNANYTVEELINKRSVVIHSYDKKRIGCANIERK
ncbi:hypothetical protein K502DRAFT_326100 [Neoconidiobolus thromboides FSU 785]|nr:hypothetical protein K502DRAFT_326100 [Neoconidiobolus thromboides FSU 785]